MAFLSLETFINTNPTVNGSSNTINVWVSESYENNLTSSYLEGMTIPEISSLNGYIKPKLAEAKELVFQYVLFDETPTTQTLNFSGIAESPTPTPSVTPSITPTVTPSTSFIPDPSPSVTPSITPTVTATPTVTPTVSPTPGASITPTPSITPTVTPTPSNTPTFYSSHLAGNGLSDEDKNDACASLNTIQIYTNAATTVVDLEVGDTLYADPNTVFANRWIGNGEWYGLSDSNGAISEIVVQINNNGQIIDLISCTSVTPTPTPSPVYSSFEFSASFAVNDVTTACNAPNYDAQLYRVSDVDGSGTSVPTTGDLIFARNPGLIPEIISVGSGKYIGLGDGTYILTGAGDTIAAISTCPSPTPTPTPTPSNTPTFYSSHLAGNGLSDLDKNDACSSLNTIEIYTRDAISVSGLQVGDTLYADPNTVFANRWIGNDEWYGLSDSNGAISEIIVKVDDNGEITNITSCASVTPTPTPSPVYTLFVISGSGDVASAAVACSSPITLRYQISDVDGSGVSAPTAGDFIYEYHPELSPASSSVTSGRYIGLENGTYVFTGANSTVSSVSVCPSPTPTPTPTPSNTPHFYSHAIEASGEPALTKDDACSALTTADIYHSTETDVANFQVGDILYSNSSKTSTWNGNSLYYGITNSSGQLPDYVFQIDSNGEILDIYSCTPPTPSPTRTPTVTPSPIPPGASPSPSPLFGGG